MMSIVQVIVRDESFELSPSLFHQLVEYSSLFDFTISLPDKQHQLSLNVDPCIFNAYLLYIQSGCFIRPDSISQEDLIHELQACGASIEIINHYERCDFISTLSSHPYLCHSINPKKQNEPIWFHVLILIGLIIGTCVFSIDLYRQMLILNKNSFEQTSKLLIVTIYLIDSVLFVYSSIQSISNFNKRKRLDKDSDFLFDIISCLGILCYFIIQRPITNVYSSPWNFLWISIHLCRTIRIIQIGYRLLDIQWCFYAMNQCLWTFFDTLIGLFWIFLFSGSILYLMDMIDNNQQYSSIYLTILSAHETLCTIGYRNNAPYGRLSRLWTIISIYFISSLVQLLCWWFQTKVTIEWKQILDKENYKPYDDE